MTHGVLIGADMKRISLLGFWVDRFRQHNPDTPIAFADFGVNVFWKARLEALEIEVLEVPWLRDRKITYSKPIAMQCSPFDATLWMDLDIETRKPINHLFEDAANGFYATLTPFHGRAAKITAPRVPIAAGFVGHPKGCTVISRWVDYTHALNTEGRLNTDNYSGDLMVLNELFAKHIGWDDLHEWPREYHWVRQWGPPPDSLQNEVLMYHWSGDRGHETINNSRRLTGDPWKEA